MEVQVFLAALKKFFLSILVVLLIFFGVRLYYFLTDGFTMNNLLSDYSVEASPPRISPPVINPPFTYLAKGSQVYAFLSQDKKTILKLVKQKHYKLHWLEKMFLSKKVKSQKCEKRHRKKEKFFQSLLLCWEELREESGLLYLHLSPTRDLPTVQIFDKLGFSHEVDLNTAEFYLQEKAVLWTEAYKENQENANDALHTLLKIASEKKIFNHDPKLNHIGLLNGRGMFIDIGEFYKEENVSRVVVEQREHHSLAPYKEWVE